MELSLTEVERLQEELVCWGVGIGRGCGHQDLSLGHAYKQILDACQTSR